MTRASYESAAAPTSHSATDPAEFNVVCRSKSNLPNQTDSNAALLPYLTHQLGSAHEWSGVWNGPKSFFSAAELRIPDSFVPHSHGRRPSYYKASVVIGIFSWQSKRFRLLLSILLRLNM